MELNIYSEKKELFKIENFNQELNYFILRNQIISCNKSEEFSQVLLTWKSILKNNLLTKENELQNITSNRNTTFELLESLRKSEIFENLEPDDKGVLDSLIIFTKQYINVLKENKFFYADKIHKYDSATLISCSTQELFDFSKNYFKSALKHRKINFDLIIEKEMKSIMNKYKFKNIYFRKPISTKDKIFILKNIEIIKKCLDTVSKDLNIDNNLLSLNGVISLSIEPNILSYSNTQGYVNTIENHHIISLGKYENQKELTETLIHEFAHCLDFLNYKNESKYTYSEKALSNLSDINFTDFTPIHQLMVNQINGLVIDVNTYKVEFNKSLEIFNQKIFNYILDEFKIKENLNYFVTKEKMKDFNATMDLITNNEYNLNRYKLIRVFAYHSLLLNESTAIDLNGVLKLSQNKDISTEEQEHFIKINNSIKEIAYQHKYIAVNNTVYFLGENQINILEEDKLNNKAYYTKPKEIFARSFELLYKEKNSLGYILPENKDDLKNLLRESVKYVINDNLLLKNNRKIKC